MQIISKTEEPNTTVIVTESHIHEISDDSKTFLLSITLCMVGLKAGSGERQLEELLPWNELFHYDGCLIFDGDNGAAVESIEPIEECSPKPSFNNEDANSLSGYYKQQAKQLLGLIGDSELVSEEDGVIAIDSNGGPIGKTLHQIQQRWASEHSPLNSHLNMTRHFEVKLKSNKSAAPKTIRVVPKFEGSLAINGDWFSFSNDGQNLEVFSGKSSFKAPASGKLTVMEEAYGSLKKTMETLSALGDGNSPTPKPLVGIDLGFLDSIIPLFDIPFLVNRFFGTFRENPAEGELGIPTTRLKSFETLLKHSVADQLWLTGGASYWGEGYAVNTPRSFAEYSSWAKNEFAKFLLPPTPESGSNDAFATTKAYLDGLIAGFSSNVFLSSHVLSLYQELWKGEFDENSLSRDLSSGVHLLRQKRHAISVINLKEIADINTENFLESIFNCWEGYLKHQVENPEPRWAHFGPTAKSHNPADGEEKRVWDMFLEYGRQQIASLKARFALRDREPANTPRPIVLQVTSDAQKSKLLPSEVDASYRFALFIKDSETNAPTYSWRSCNWVLPSLPDSENPDSGNFEHSVLVPVNLPEVNGVQTSRVYLSNEKSSLVANTEISYQTVETHSFRVTQGKDLLKRDEAPNVQVNWIELGEVISVTVEKEILVKCSTSVFFDDPVQISVGEKLESRKEGDYWLIGMKPSTQDKKVSFKISLEALDDDSDISNDAFEIWLAEERISIVKLDYARVPTINLQPVGPRSPNDESDRLPYFVYGRRYNVSACRIPRSGYLPSFLRQNVNDCVTPRKKLSDAKLLESGWFEYRREVFVHPFRLKHAANRGERTAGYLEPFQSTPDVFPVTLDVIGKSSAEEDNKNKNRVLYILFPDQTGKVEIHRPVTPFWDWFAWNFRADQRERFATALKTEMENREQNKSKIEVLPDCCVTKCRIKIERLFSLSGTNWPPQVRDVEIDIDTFSPGKPISLDFKWDNKKCVLTIKGAEESEVVDLEGESSYRFTLTSMVPKSYLNRISRQLWETTSVGDSDSHTEFAPVEFFIELALDKPTSNDAVPLYESLALNNSGGIVEARLKLPDGRRNLFRIGRLELSQQIWYWDGRNFDQESSPLPSYSGTTANGWDGIGFGNRFDHDCRTRNNRIIAGIEDQLVYTEDRSKVLRGDVIRFALRGYDRYLGLRPTSPFIDALQENDRWKRLYISTKLTEKLPPPSIRFVNQLAYSITDSRSQLASVAVVFNDRWFAAAGVSEKLETRIVKAKVKVKGEEKEFYNAGVDPTLSATKTLSNETGKISDTSESALIIRGPFAFTFDKVARTPELVRTAFVLELNCGVVEHWISESQTKLEDVKSVAYADGDSQSVTLASFLCQVQFRRVVRESKVESSQLDSDWCDPVWVEFTPNAGTNTLVPVSGTLSKRDSTLTFSLKFDQEFEERHERWLILLKQQRDIRGELVSVFDNVFVPVSSAKESDGLRTTVTYDANRLPEGDSDYVASILLVRKRNAIDSPVSPKTQDSEGLNAMSVFQRMFGEFGSGLGDPSAIRDDAEVAKPLLGPSFPLRIQNTAKRDEPREPFDSTDDGMRIKSETFHETIAVLMERIAELEDKLADKNTVTKKPN
jgi:hypothetical protein